MKNTFIAAMFIFWGFVVAVISAGYVVKQNRLAQESMQKNYTDSIQQIVDSVNKGKSGDTTQTVTYQTAPTTIPTSPTVNTVPPVKIVKPVVTKPASVVITPKPVPTPVADPTPAASTGLTMDTVAMHSTQSDCWIVINGNVYSVASYIPMHPGGARRIANLCGGDATSGYDRQGHSSYADSLLGGYLVGPLQ